MGRGFSHLLARLVLCTGAVMPLGGCGPATPTDTLADYHQRVARVLELPPSVPTITPLPTNPERRQLRLPETPLRISLLDFLRLSGCALSESLGRRNSALGKLAPPSQRMHMSREILMDGPQCALQLQAQRPQLAQELATLLEVKRDERMRIWWNAWITSDEWQDFTSTAALPLSAAEAAPAAISAGLQALTFSRQQGLQWQQQQWPYDTDTMEFQQRQLSLSQLVGAWRRSQQLLTVYSHATAALLEQRQQTRPLCPAGRPSARARILHNVFFKFYADVFQRYLSRTDRLGTELLTQLRALPKLVTPPPAYTTWMAQLQQEHSALTAAHARHVEAWQTTLSACDLMPTGR